MKNYIKILVLFLLLSYNGQAQILNLNKQLIQNDSIKWLGQVRLFFTLIDQEVSVANMGGNLDLVRKFKKHSLMTVSKVSFARSNSETLLSDGYAHLRMIFNRHKKLGEEVFWQIQYNAIRGMQDRNLVGGGFRYILMDSEKYGLLAGSAVMKEWESWLFNDAIKDVSIIKSSNYLSLFAEVNKNFHFNVISYYQASFTNFFQPRVSLEINLNINLTERLLFTSNFTAYYDAQPIIPIDKFVYKFKNGLGYKF